MTEPLPPCHVAGCTEAGAFSENDFLAQPGRLKPTPVYFCLAHWRERQPRASIAPAAAAPRQPTPEGRLL